MVVGPSDIETEDRAGTLNKFLANLSHSALVTPKAEHVVGTRVSVYKGSGRHRIRCAIC